MRDVIPTWVYDVLKEYHNVAIPDEVVDHYGVDYLSDLLSDIMGEKVEVREQTIYYDFDIGQSVTKRKGVVYTAWM